MASLLRISFRKQIFTVLLFPVILILGITQNGSATNGYFPHGYGTTNDGLAGAGASFPQDSLTVATNPAGLAFLGSRYDAALILFNPNRQFTETGGAGPQGTLASDSRLFEIPSFGANWTLNGNSSIGLAIYGNGGMNTDYNPSNGLPFGNSNTGVDLSQLFVVPTYAVKVTPNHAFGISPVLAYQMFEAKGLQMFNGMSSDPNNLTDNGHANSYGYGAKIGYLGKILPELNLGLAYHSRTKMTKFSQYAGLFAGQGGFDIPSSWNAGVSYQPLPEWTLVLDAQTINYSEIKSIANPFASPGPLGADNGPGFGWKDMTTIKAGLQWQSSPDWTWRMGYSKGNQPIGSSEVLFNILAPGVIEQHATFGFTKKTAADQAFQFALMRAFSNSVSGPNPMNPGQTIELQMDEWQVDFGYSWNISGTN